MKKVKSSCPQDLKAFLAFFTIVLISSTNNSSLVTGTFINYYYNTYNNAPEQHVQSRIRIIESTTSTSSSSSSSELQLKINLVDNLEKLLIGSLFPTDDETEEEDPRKELASFTDLTSGIDIENTSSARDVGLAHDSLAAFLLEWGRTLEKTNDGPDKLPTPVSCIPFVPRMLSNDAMDDDGDGDDVAEKETGAQAYDYYALKEDGWTVQKTTGVKLSFRKTKRYLSRNEQRGLEKGVVPDRKGAKIDLWSPGGILLIVETLVPSSDRCNSTTKTGHMEDTKSAGDENHRLQLSVKRCDIDGDTVVKVSSENTIVRRLKEAVQIWSNMRSILLSRTSTMNISAAATDD